MNNPTGPADARAGAHWANVNDFSFLLGMCLLLWIFKTFGRWPFRIVLAPVLMWYMLVRPASRRASREYLDRVAAMRADSQPRLGVLAHFASFAETMLDKMLLWSGGFSVDSVELVGKSLISQQIASGRGAVIVCAHFGNLDLCRMLSYHHPTLRMTLLVHTKHAQTYNALLGSLNPLSQADLMQVTDITPATAMLLAERVEQGGFVVIAGDRVPVSVRPRVAMAEFLGQSAPFPVGPYVLASALQCPIYLLFSMHCNGRYAVHFEHLSDTVRLPRREREARIADLVSGFAQRLEYHCLQAPLQWFNFYDFWHLTKWDDNADAEQ